MGPQSWCANVVVLTEHLSVKADILASLYDRAKQDQSDAVVPVLISQSRPPRQVQRRFTTVEAGEIAERYQAGQTMNQLARTYHVHRRTIAHCLQKQQVALRQPGLSPDHLERAAMLYQAGWSLARIGDEFGTTDMSVRRTLAKYGIVIRPRRGWS